MTYEYCCVSCEHEWEIEQKISESPLTECPKCGKSSAKRLVSGGQGFQLKGGGVGWAANKYSGS